MITQCQNVWDTHTHHRCCATMRLLVCVCLCVSLLHQRFCWVSSFINSQNKNSCNSWRVLIFFGALMNRLLFCMGYFGFVKNMGSYANRTVEKGRKKVQLIWIQVFFLSIRVWSHILSSTRYMFWARTKILKYKKITLFFRPSSWPLFFRVQIVEIPFGFNIVWNLHKFEHSTERFGSDSDSNAINYGWTIFIFRYSLLKLTASSVANRHRLIAGFKRNILLWIF